MSESALKRFDETNCITQTDFDRRAAST